MLLAQLDMPTARYVCSANEGFISYRIGAKRQYIELELSESISSSSFVNIFHESEYIDRKKQSKNRRKCILLLLLFSACAGVPRSECNELWGFAYMGLGLAHKVFD